MTTTAGLLNTPTDGPSFDRWSFDLDQNVRDISAAILAQLGVQLPQYQLTPVPFMALGDWLQRVSQAIDNIASLLKINAVDVENVDLENEKERQDWANSIFTELTAARRALQI
jgi:hypothetical protein